MVQDKPTLLTFSLLYAGLSIVFIIYSYSLINMSDWMMYILLLFLGFLPMFSGIGYILKVFSQPEFKIENVRVKESSSDSGRPIKDLYFDIRNTGKSRAKGCNIKINVKNHWGYFLDLRLPHTHEERATNINSGNHITILFTQVYKKSPNVSIYTISNQSPALPKDDKYVLELKITGDNFPERKLQNIELDLKE